MGTGTLQIDLDAIVSNWRALDAMSATGCQTGAVVKADAYGLGAVRVASALAAAGVRQFFVAVAWEGAALRAALGPGPQIVVFGGHMAGDAGPLGDADLVPLLNSIEQMTRHFETLPGAAFGVQLDTGMNRLGLEPVEWQAARDIALAQGPTMILSHLACADDPGDAMNARQQALFAQLTAGLDIPRSLSATGGVLLGADYHFDIARPGIGLYGGAPFTGAGAVVRLSLPVVQVRDVAPGETVGYGGAWLTDVPARIAAVSGGYADGLIRALGDETGNGAVLFAGSEPCPLVGRMSMDLMTVDVTHLDAVPDTLEILGPQQGIDDLAAAAGTIGYEILTSLGSRYDRRYLP